MSTDWQPLSVRSGKREPDGPYEGMPIHLQHSVGEWLRGRFGWFKPGGGLNNDLMAQVAASLRIPVQRTYKPGGISDQIFAAIEKDEDLYLDCLDATLHISRGGSANTLSEALRVGGSVWTVREDRRGLERRVSESTAASYSRSIQANDDSSNELKEAWAAVYGRNPNPSDAWDHAIKAIEDLLIPVITPKMIKANLGSVAGELKAHPELWTFGLPGNGERNNGETLEGLIRHIWPNPDRHGGSSKRAPTQDEAEAAVQIAVLIVGICRDRLIKTHPGA